LHQILSNKKKLNIFQPYLSQLKKKNNRTQENYIKKISVFEQSQKKIFDQSKTNEKNCNSKKKLIKTEIPVFIQTLFSPKIIFLFSLFAVSNEKEFRKAR